jgi:DNA-dependent RNA polymerase auxiliary subunit epsilon
MNETPTGTTTKDRHAAAKALASMRVNSEFVSNEIDDSKLQYERHSEQRI